MKDGRKSSNVVVATLLNCNWKRPC